MPREIFDINLVLLQMKENDQLENGRNQDEIPLLWLM
jgi:hypothetical protein